jgi:hypothetical protein
LYVMSNKIGNWKKFVENYLELISVHLLVFVC